MPEHTPQQRGDFYQPWMDEPLVKINDFESTQIHIHTGRVYLASRRTNNGSDAIYQNWCYPVRKAKGKEYIDQKAKHIVGALVGTDLYEAEATLTFFLNEIKKKIAKEKVIDNERRSA